MVSGQQGDMCRIGYCIRPVAATAAKELDKYRVVHQSMVIRVCFKEGQTHYYVIALILYFTVQHILHRLCAMRSLTRGLLSSSDSWNCRTTSEWEEPTIFEGSLEYETLKKHEIK